MQPRMRHDTGRRFSIGAAVIGSIAASACCIGPLVLAALGIGGAGAFIGLTSYRPYILSLSAVLLATGFYLTYRRPAVTLDGDACTCERPRAARAGKWTLWTATLAVVLLAAFPTLAARFAGSRANSRHATTFDVITQTAVI